MFPCLWVNFRPTYTHITVTKPIVYRKVFLRSIMLRSASRISDHSLTGSTRRVPFGRPEMSFRDWSPGGQGEKDEEAKVAWSSLGQRRWVFGGRVGHFLAFGCMFKGRLEMVGAHFHLDLT